jgi:uncharacterized protein (DUF1800 family)
MNLRILEIFCVLAFAVWLLPMKAFAEPANQAAGLHVLNRLAYGPRRGDIERVMQIGVERYIDEQLHPDRIPMPEPLAQRLAALSQDEMSQADLITTYRRVIKAAMDDRTGGAPGGGVAIRNALYKKMAVRFAELRLIRTIESPRQLEEVMDEFWFNHFNVVAGKGLDHVLIADYEREAIRPYVLGKFRDLLGATSKHPAMLFYLDNWLSSAPSADARPRIAGTKAEISGLNENYARELMELHTLGADGGYSQEDVTALARIMTGWSFDPRSAGTGPTFRFVPRLHDFGDKIWLGRVVPVKGRAEGEWALDVLAAHPSTAHHIAYELAQYFVADDPPAALVNRLAQQFLATDGDIRAVLSTLFASPEFRDPANYDIKFKTPYQFVVSAVRAADVEVRNVRPLLATMTRLGMPLYGCQSPDGYKNTEAAWLNPDALAQRVSFATALGLGRIPLGRVVDDGKANDPYAPPAMGADTSSESADNGVSPPPDFQALLATLGDQITDKTRTRIALAEPSTLRAALVLGGPDFMRH